MAKRVYIDPEETDADVVLVDDQCYQRIADSNQPPDGSQIEQEYGSCDDCGDCVGIGEFFQMGTAGSFVASCTGRLQLWINDGYLSDNNGSWSITITPGGTYVLSGTNQFVNGPCVERDAQYTYSASGVIRIASSICPATPDGWSSLPSADCPLNPPPPGELPDDQLRIASLIGRFVEDAGC